MHPKQIVVLVLSLGLGGCFTACKTTLPPSQPAAADRPRPAIDANKLTDEQLVAASQQDGLGIGLRVPGNGTFSASQRIPLHILIEDFAARIPVASGLCGGFYLIYEDAETHDLSSGQITLNQRCFDSEPYPDAIPFDKKKIKVVDSNTVTASHIEFTPGKYLFSIEWHAFPAGPGTIGEREAYTTLHSNAIPVTITR